MYIHLKDSQGTQISEGTGAAPLVTPSLLATTNSVTDPISITVYTDSGYQSVGDTTISFVGTSAAKWSISATSDGVYTSSLTITEAINSTGTTVYVKASSSSDETTPTNDSSVDISISTTIGAV
jgi:hypothetical protein